MKNLQSQNASGYFSGEALMTIAMITSGTIGYFVLLSEQSPLNTVFFRCVIGSLFIIAYVLLKKLFDKSILNIKTITLIAIGGVSLSLNWFFLFSAYKHTSIGIATTIYHVQPFFVFIAGSLFFKEVFHIHKSIWLVCAFIGIVLIIQPDNSSQSSYFLGCFYALIAALLYTLTTIITKRLSNIPAPIIAMLQLIISAVVFVGFADFNALPQSSIQWFSIIVLGVVHTGLMYIIMYNAFQKLQASKIAIYSYIYPITAVMIDYLFLDATLNLWQIFGGVLVLMSSLLFNLNINILKPFKKHSSDNV